MGVKWKILHKNGVNKLLVKKTDDDETYINCEPWEYDFKYEYVNMNEGKNGNLWNEKDKIKRFFRWECDSIFENYVDLDACYLARDIYLKLWGWVAPGRSYNYIDTYFPMELGPDTMNSFATLFETYIQEHTQFCDQDYWKEFKKAKPRQKLSKLLIYTWWLSSQNKGKYLKDLGIGVSEEEESCWSKYALYTHTMGNFVLVPAGFNKTRSSQFGDFWDLSLTFLKREERNNVWLSGTNIFTKYINYFFLWDYVACVEEKFYKVKSLLSSNFKCKDYPVTDSHSGICDDSKTVPSRDEIKNFLRNCNWAIKRRGAFMTLMLSIREKLGENKYSELRRAVFARGDKSYKGYDDVISAIRKKLSEKDAKEMDEIFKKMSEVLVEKAETS